VKYRFINEHRHEYKVATMCRVLKVARAGFYAWLHQPDSNRAIEDGRLLGLIPDSYIASGGVYGSPRVFADLREAGETCGKHRIERIMRHQEVIVHSDHGSQYVSNDWKRFCDANKLVPSMSRRGNCWDNAVAESFFSSLKKERTRKRNYKTRDLARADVFDYIEAFYNRTRRHSHPGGVSPEAFERASI
jgi:putative transposase